LDFFIVAVSMEYNIRWIFHLVYLWLQWGGCEITFGDDCESFDGYFGVGFGLSLVYKGEWLEVKVVRRRRNGCVD
jgi:hypothetical protein